MLVTPTARKWNNGLPSFGHRHNTRFEKNDSETEPFKLIHKCCKTYCGRDDIIEVTGSTDNECLTRMLLQLRIKVPEEVNKFCEDVKSAYRNAESFGKIDVWVNPTRYKIKETGQECFVSNGVVWVPTAIDHSQVEIVGAENRDYLITKRVSETVKIDSIMKYNFSLKDSVDIPINNESVTFVVEHIREFENFNDVYFMAKDAINFVPSNRIIEVLDEIESQMPGEILSKMRKISHKSKIDGEELVRKITIPSVSNIKLSQSNKEICCGDDDFIFDGMIRQVDRSKYLIERDKKGELRKDSTNYYVWPRYSITGTNDLYIVNTIGEVKADSNNHGYQQRRAIVPMFCLRIMKDKENA